MVIECLIFCLGGKMRGVYTLTNTRQISFEPYKNMRTNNELFPVLFELKAVNF